MTSWSNLMDIGGLIQLLVWSWFFLVPIVIAYKILKYWQDKKDTELGDELLQQKKEVLER